MHIVQKHWLAFVYRFGHSRGARWSALCRGSSAITTMRLCGSFLRIKPRILPILQPPEQHCRHMFQILFPKR